MILGFELYCSVGWNQTETDWESHYPLPTLACWPSSLISHTLPGTVSHTPHAGPFKE